MIFYRLKSKYNEIHQECLKRGLKVRYYGAAWNNVPPELMKDYQPTMEAKELRNWEIMMFKREGLANKTFSI